MTTSVADPKPSGRPKIFIFQRKILRVIFYHHNLHFLLKNLYLYQLTVLGERANDPFDIVSTTEENLNRRRGRR